MPGKRWPPVPPPQTIAFAIRFDSRFKAGQSDSQIFPRIFGGPGIVFSAFALQLLHGLLETFRTIPMGKAFILMNKLVEPTIKVFGLVTDTADCSD
jgi:hypothetical protein